MGATDEQKAADRALEEAIDRMSKAYGEEGLLMEWVVITAHHIDDGEGGSATGIDYFASDDLPVYRMQGLIEFVRDRLKDVIRSDHAE